MSSKHHHLLLIAGMILMALFTSCHNNSKNTDPYAGAPNFKKHFPEKTVKIEKYYVKDNQDSIITYSSMEEAEWKMIHYFFPDRVDIQNMKFDYFNFDYDLLEKIIMSDTSSMSFSFDSICHYADVSILDSEDGNIRFYVWEPPHDWRGSDGHTIVQYRWDGNIHWQTSLYEDWTGTFPISLHEFMVNGTKYYLTADHFFYGGETFVGYSIYELTPSGIQELAGHDSDFAEEGRIHAISYEYYPSDWYTRTSGMGYDWLDYFDETTNTLYVPEEDVYLTDRYIRYQWDGKQIKQVEKKSVANPYLHQSLNEYEKLEFVKKTTRNIIRIDKMKNDTYRYAAWKADEKISDKPELVILNGSYDKKAEQFIFRNKEYEYRVTLHKITIFKNDEKIAEEFFQ